MKTESGNESLASAGSEDGVLADCLEEWTTRLQAGEPVGLDDYIRRYPAYAGGLRRLAPTIEMMSGMGHVRPPSDERAVGDRQNGLGSGILGDFRMLREVGRGGMGVVYEAEQVSLSRRVALKILPLAAALDPRRYQRFQLEAQAAACLHHTSIVPIHAVGTERGVPFYAMQFIDGQSLAEVIRELRSLEGRGSGFECEHDAAKSSPSLAARS